MPSPLPERFAPDDAQDASYLAASARMASFSCVFIGSLSDAGDAQGMVWGSEGRANIPDAPRPFSLRFIQPVRIRT